MKFGNLLVSLLLVRHWNILKSRKKLLGRILAGAAVILLVNFMAGCYYYRASTTSQPPQEELLRLSDLDKKFVVHNDLLHYFVHSVTFLEDSLELQLDSAYYQREKDISTVKPNSSHRYRKKKEKDARLLNEVHLYVNQNVELADTVWMVPISAIERMDVYNHSSQATTTYSILFGLALIPGAIIVIALIALLIALLSGSSCPFIYVWNGQEYEFAGEIYSGAVYPPLERHDYLLLTGLVEENGEYKLMIANELEEVQHTNLLELMVFDHAPGQEVLVDKYGTAHTISDALTAVSATSLRGENLLPIVEKEDDLIYLGSDPSKDPPLLDGVELAFQIPEGTEKADLVISAKNSFWLDFVYQNFRDMLGVSYKTWMKKQQDGDPDKFESWSLSQNIPLSVYLMKNGEWVFYDYYHTVGPMAFKKDILELDLSNMDPGLLKIKLEAGSYFWEIGYVGLDLDQTSVNPVKSIALSKATDENGKSVMDLLLKDDELYYVQPDIGNQAMLSFPVPEQSGGRTLVLHSKGHYDIKMDPRGAPKIKALKEIRKTGNFNKYSNRLMQEMLDEHMMVNGKE
jgi:hypothetical protein